MTGENLRHELTKAPALHTRGLVLALAVAACQHARPDVPADGSRDAPGDVSTTTDLTTVVDAAPMCPNPVSGTNLSFRPIGQVAATGAILATSPPDDPRLFVLEQTGAIRLFKDEVLQTTPFVDLSTAAGGPIIGFGDGREEGLLGLAFHPQYATNGLFFIFYTGSRNGDFHDFLARCHVSATDPDLAATSCVELIAVTDFASNHNGGMVEFGSDGYLYVSTGDGGGAGDPMRNAQNLDSLFGKMLRLDVDHPANGKEYGIPADNPFALGGGAPEVFMWGLRNPWRWSFDRGTGDMWIGDVGQGLIEELDVLRPSQQKGKNLGWSAYEGNLCCATTDYKCLQTGTQYPCDPTGLTFPQDSRTHDEGWTAIIDGQTYRGSCFPDLVGWHFYTDYGAHSLIKARLKADDTLEIVDTGVKTPGDPSSLHADARGELYLTTTNGFVYRMEVLP